MTEFSYFCKLSVCTNTTVNNLDKFYNLKHEIPVHGRNVMLQVHGIKYDIMYTTINSYYHAHDDIMYIKLMVLIYFIGEKSIQE
jgi:hypothetical protein